MIALSHPSGKTLQCIALVWTLLKQSPRPEMNQTVRGCLIIAPSSLVQNWAKEFKKWLSNERIKVFTVDQNNKVEHFLRQDVSKVLILSYDTFIRTHEVISTPNAKFDLLICDEAHRLKNSQSKTTTLISALPIKKRVLLTGTPLQNDLQVSCKTVII